MYWLIHVGCLGQLDKFFQLSSLIFFPIYHLWDNFIVGTGENKLSTWFQLCFFIPY